MQYFSNVPARVVGVGYAASLVLVGILVLADEGEPSALGVVLLVIGVADGVAFYRSATVMVGEGRVVLRGHLSTRSLDIQEVQYASIQIGRTGLASGDRQFIRLILADGTDQEFRQFNAPSGLDRPTVVERAVEAVNAARVAQG